MIGGNTQKNIKEELEETYGTGKVNVVTPDNENYEIKIEDIGTYSLKETGDIETRKTRNRKRSRRLGNNKYSK